ncbi:hypothetical protein SAMN05216283_1019 [Sunxiuqinia elliptica]|uniref:Uncharacterized protein n=1 Tax=Sunxiuqinia elliptica TaxID=655355 RepID=A0A1I2A2N4_9BACT|nr:hypothetical protein SAMN05216283_1019 [Sunxiuqinia elliptica]
MGQGVKRRPETGLFETRDSPGLLNNNKLLNCNYGYTQTKKYDEPDSKNDSV